MNEKKRKMLNVLIEELDESEDFEEISLFTAEELGAPADIARALISDVGSELIDVLGEFLFMPYKDEEMLYFTSVITLTDEIMADEQVDIALAVARINYVIPNGCFSLGENGKSLVYRYTVPIPADLKDDDIKAMMLTAVDAALTVVDRFEGFLSLVIEGNLSPEEMMTIITGTSENEEQSGKEE